MHHCLQRWFTNEFAMKGCVVFKMTRKKTLGYFKEKKIEYKTPSIVHRVKAMENAMNTKWGYQQLHNLVNEDLRCRFKNQDKLFWEALFNKIGDIDEEGENNKGEDENVEEEGDIEEETDGNGEETRRRHGEFRGAHLVGGPDVEEFNQTGGGKTETKEVIRFFLMNSGYLTSILGKIYLFCVVFE